MTSNSAPLLDLFSISQKTYAAFPSDSDSTKPDSVVHLRCDNNAPFFAYPLEFGSGYGVTQGCCNSWTCKRCGQMRARREYGRIVHGLNEIAHQYPDVFFITLTCKGAGLSVKKSQQDYLKWTNRVLSRWRANSRGRGLFWCYVQVTERQKRGHPHSHLLTTWFPHDLQPGTRKTWKTGKHGREYSDKPVLLSDYLQQSVVDAGLGKIYDISKARNIEAVSRYVAKYLFKDSMGTVMPKNWRRVRYSHSFPKLPEIETDAFVLLSRDDWRRLARLTLFVNPDSQASYDHCVYNLANADVVIRDRWDRWDGETLEF